MKGPVVHTILTRATSTVLNFAIALVIARHAGPLVKGEVTLLLTIVTFYSFFSNIFGGQVLIYLIPKGNTEWIILPAYLWSMVVALMGFIVLSITPICPPQLVLPVTMLGLLSSLTGIHQSLLMARQQIYSANTLTVIPLLFQMCGLYLCFYQWDINGADAFIYSAIAGYIFTSFYGLWLSKPDFKKEQQGHSLSAMLQEQFRYGLKFQLVEVLQLLNLRYYFFQLGLQQGAQYLGVFSIGISVLEAVWIIPRSMAAVNYVDTSTAKKQDTERTVFLLKLNTLLVVLALLLIFMVPNHLYVRVFGSGFADVKHSMRFLYPGILLYSFHFIMASFFLGRGQYGPLLIANTVGVLTLAVAAYFLIPVYVMSGAGLSATLSFAAATVVLFLFFVQKSKET
ncbi:MAG: hypothetical protein IPN22_13450 [Bacteroidetes bacterium]|nr:hypothetical protein [Bacteroidota bacterium]